MTGTNLRGADLSSANVEKVILRGADLHGADLRGTKFTGGDLRGADLSAVDLRSGVLYNAANLTIEQLCSVKSLWLTELNEWRSEAEKHCPHLLEQPTSGT